MPSHHRSSISSGQRADSSQDVERDLLDALNKAHTELNKARGERDRYKTLYEELQNPYGDLKKRVSESALALKDLRAQLQSATKEKNSYREKCLQNKEDYDVLNENWARRYKELEAKYNSLSESHDDLKTTATTNPVASPLPDRTKESRPSKKEYLEERGRDREKDRKKEKEKEKKAEKERLSKRFEERRPPTSNRRSSFVEDWGPSGRSTSANPSNRTYMAGRMQRPLASHHGGDASPSVPRTPNPRSPGGVYSSGSSGVHDDDSYEDGNYHPYPIQRYG